MTTPRDDRPRDTDTPRDNRSRPQEPRSGDGEPVGFHYGFVDGANDSGRGPDTDPAAGDERAGDRPAGSGGDHRGNRQPDHRSGGGSGPARPQPGDPRQTHPERASVGNPGDDRLWETPGLLGGGRKKNSAGTPRGSRTDTGWRDREEQNGGGLPAGRPGATAPGRTGQAGRPVKALPAGWPVGSFTSYADAQAAVDMLSDNGDFPVSDVSIVGVDLMEVEKVVGRLSWGKVLGRGALSGAWMGLFIGVLISMFQTELVAPLLAGLAMGIVFGLVTAGVPYAMSRGSRDFATTTQIIANRYDVICAPESARRARDLIARQRTRR